MTGFTSEVAAKSCDLAVFCTGLDSTNACGRDRESVGYLIYGIIREAWNTRLH